MIKNVLFYLLSRLKCLGGSTLTIYFLICVQSSSFGQASSAPVNQFARLSAVTHSNLEVTSSSIPFIGGDAFDPKNNLIDNTTGAVWGYIGGGSAWIEVKDNAATSGQEYKEGSYAGFVVDAASIDLISNITVKTYLGATMKQSKSASELISVAGGGHRRIGFWTTKNTSGGNNDFDRIRIEYSALGIAGTRTVYYAEVIRYGAAPNLLCNTPTAARLAGASEAGFPVAVVAGRTGADGLCIGCAVTDRTYVIDSDPSTSAKLTLAIGVNATASISVATVGQINPAGTFAGFDLSNPKLLAVGVLSGIKVETYLNGSPTGESISGGSLLNVSSSLVAGSERKVIGFKTSLDFDEVRLTVEQTGVDLGTTDVFGLVLTNFCNDATLTCNTPTAAKIPANSIYVDGRHTGITSLACVGCAITNPDHAIDNDDATAASIVSVVGGAATASFAVSNAVTIYQENSFAGFDIETKSIAGATLLGTATVELLLNGIVVAGSSSGSIVLGVNSSLLNGTNRQTIGVVAKPGVTYNGVRISFDKAAGVDLGEIKIHGAVFQRNCVGAAVACGQSVNLNSPVFPVVINSARTGYGGVACVGCYVDDAWNVISPSIIDYAEIGNLLSGLGRSSISVYDPIDTHPIGAFAGFTIKKESFPLAASLFDQLIITTYNDGVQQEEKSGNSLLNLTVISQIFGTASDFGNVGFVTEKPFDEIRISVASLSAFADQYIKVYGAFIDTRTASVGALRCFNTNPDNNVARKGVEATGNVSTNDMVANGTTYGTPVASPGHTNPGPELPEMNEDGSYTFTTDKAGVYTFDVPVCVAGYPTCTSETLTITVVELRSATNSPIANDDVATMTGDPTTTTPLLVDVLMNDGPGNRRGALQSPTIETQPLNGEATVVDNKIRYTPNPGFYGEDIIVYKVCESPSNICTTANLVVTVLEPAAPNTVSAADDYVFTASGQTVTVPVEDGVLGNDKGSNLTVTAQETDVAGVGTLVLEEDGSYVFTPDEDFVGTAPFVYQVCDDQENCQNATLYIQTEELPGSLPVTLVRFDVQKEGHVVSLTWATSGETNSDLFDVQQSSDAKVWKSVGEVKSSGESAVQRGYHFAHQSPDPGLNYYRLKMVDLDKSFAYSTVRKINLEEFMVTTVYPNPASSNLTIDASNWGTVAKLEMVNISGATVYSSGKMSGNQIDIKNFASGIYVLKLIRKDGSIERIKATIVR